MNQIKNIINFNKLFLVWQAPNDLNHTRYVVAELQRNQEGQVSLTYLKNSSDFLKAREFGFDGYPAFPIDKDVHSIGVLEAFMRRLPPKSREDFPKYLETLRLPENIELDPFTLLAYSGARLPGNEFSIFPNFDTVNQPFQFLIEVAGFRKVSKIPIEEIAMGTSVTFEEEPDNIIDKNAVKVLMNGNHIGYVTRSILATFRQWLHDKRIQRAIVERKDGQYNNPTLYLFVDLLPKS